MQHIMSFEYENQSIRVMRGEDNKPWFGAVDVCKVLELADTFIYDFCRV